MSVLVVWVWTELSWCRISFGNFIQALEMCENEKRTCVLRQQCLNSIRVFCITLYPQRCSLILFYFECESAIYNLLGFCLFVCLLHLLLLLLLLLSVSQQYTVCVHVLFITLYPKRCNLSFYFLNIFSVREQYTSIRACHQFISTTSYIPTNVILHFFKFFFWSPIHYQCACAQRRNLSFFLSFFFFFFFY